MYGVEVHANALQNILDGEHVRPMGRGAKLPLLLVVALIAGAVVFWRGVAWGAAATVAAGIATLVYAWWAWAGAAYVPGGELFAFGRRFAWVPVGSPILSALFAYVGSVAYVAVIEGRDKRLIRGAFGKYVSPDVLDEITKNPEALKLGGQKQPLTLLFSDLSGFTTLSENMDPEDLLTLLNEYLDDMTQIVLDEKGYVDKYIGDAIMAFWNAPKAVDDHADRAIRVAVLMQRRMADLNRGWREENPAHEDLRVRIGVHTGEVVVGNVGGEERINYSAIGDPVNLAARLEPANKTYDTLNMVSEASLAAAERSLYRVRDLDLIAVKGKAEPVQVYELLELAGVPLSADREEALRHYAAGMAAYKARDWGGARGHFRRALEACPSDGPSRVYDERCTDHIANPPPPDWDFVVYRTEK
jgi:adenylate cyclase